MSPEPHMDAALAEGRIKKDKSFTWQELSQHNSRHDAFIAIRGKVYDVTKFIRHHPGGGDTLLLAAGRDATVLFESYHPLETSQRLKKYEIGYLITNELPVFPSPSEFFVTVRKRVNDYFEQTNQDPKNNSGIWLRYAGIFVAYILAYYLQFYNWTVQSNIFLQICVAAAFGFINAEIGQHWLHDACHFAVTHSPLVWKVLVSSVDYTNGTSHLSWMYQHIVGHHAYTNINGADPDVTTSDPGFWRIRADQKWFIHYGKQHLLQPIFYGLLLTKWRLEDFYTLFLAKKKVTIRVNPITTKDLIIFWTGKIFFVTFRILIPWMVTPYSFKQICLLLFVADLVYSYWLVFVFQSSHVVEGAAWPEPDENNFVDTDWAKMQVITTQDYNYNSEFWTFITGALNYQAVHHLFPEINQHYYPEIGTIVRETCMEFGFASIYKETFTSAVSSHLNHLKVLSQKPLKTI